MVALVIRFSVTFQKKLVVGEGGTEKSLKTLFIIALQGVNLKSTCSSQTFLSPQILSQLMIIFSRGLSGNQILVNLIEIILIMIE